MDIFVIDEPGPRACSTLGNPKSAGFSWTVSYASCAQLLMWHQGEVAI